MTEIGPCVICGGTNYPLSMGGPTICPSCDCGDFGMAKVQRQAKEIERLTAENENHIEALRAEVERLRAALQQVASLPTVDGTDNFEVNRRGQELRLNEQAREIARCALEPKP